MEEINGNAAHSSGTGNRQEAGKLQDTLCANEVDLKRRTLRIAMPGRAGNPGAGLGEQRIVDGQTHRRRRIQLLQARRTDAGEQCRRIQALLGKQPVRRGPILKLSAGGAEQSGEGVTSQAQKRA